MQNKTILPGVKPTTTIDPNGIFLLITAVILFLSPLGYSYELKPVIVSVFLISTFLSVANGTFKVLSPGEVYAILFSFLVVCLTLFRDPGYSIAGFIDLLGVSGIFLVVYP